jgi:TRAP-type mannitol/chloroaromatic compound transport system substrate-binding protein
VREPKSKTPRKTAKQDKVSRRRFLKGGGIAAAAAAGTIAFPQVSRAQTVTLKMQSSWPPTDVFHDMAKEYVDRVHAMSGGRSKIDLPAAGAVVKPFQLQDAVHDGVLDGAHWVTAYWYGKNKAASLFGTDPMFGCNAAQMLA